MILDGFETASIRRAAEALRRGGVVVFPTETVYGLGADALNATAVAKIFEIKRRPYFDPLIVHVVGRIDRYAYDGDSRIGKLTRAFWPGPLTLVLPKKPIIPDLVTSGLDTIAVRAPDHPVAQRLIRALRRPIAAPSANLFGRLSPTTARHVELKVPIVLDGGPCRVGVESTVLSLVEPKAVLLRPGGVPVEDIERLIGPVKRGSDKIQSPGQLPQHYAPRTPLRPLSSKVPRGRIGLLAFRKPRVGFASVEVLSSSGDLREAAANLFASMRALDSRRLDLIVFEKVPERGLGRAIMDRLRRASATL
jgi:L-threonylcarbamoyladenylate synthase